MNTENNPDENVKINCMHCIHYANTWNVKFPRSCRYFGFKCAQMPSAVVYESSGERCGYFADKRRKR
ncbi:MAG: uracil-DNA glycosylase [Defluviitaleaceae bacterium]|nr:uracil-DNA glycosylase [Defluviitaleaceae bacterium]MCL2264071.1 uracil-DNA glycosylase [Defluviitaleaceae bacterium]